MKKIRVLMLVVFTMTLFSAVTVSAHEENQGWHNHSWQDKKYCSEHFPFHWNESLKNHSHGERIRDHGWNHRFPGLKAYKWHGDDFRYKGKTIRNAVLFYNHENKLIAVGFMFDGKFTMLKSDHNCYESRDSFYRAWWRNMD